MACRRHVDFDAECFACHISTVSFAAAATPTRRAGTVAKVDTENRWSADHAAYRRMRANGLQPRNLDGSARLEAHAETQMEVEYGDLLTKPQIAEATEAMNAATDIREELRDVGN